jgi:hypothetical protein
MGKLINKQYYRVIDIKSSREDFCGIGTCKIKRRLNKIAKTEAKALFLRNLLELEDANLSAKRYFGKHRRRYYEKKIEKLNQLVDHCKELKLKYGYAIDPKQTFHNKVFYLEYEEFQFSWHYGSGLNFIPKYENPWDGNLNSTLGKVEILITREYPHILQYKTKQNVKRENKCQISFREPLPTEASIKNYIGVSSNESLEHSEKNPFQAITEIIAYECKDDVRRN